jgi:hypothetical protein
MIYPFCILHMMGRGVIHTEHKPLGCLYLGVTYAELTKELVTHFTKTTSTLILFGWSHQNSPLI